MDISFLLNQSCCNLVGKLLGKNGKAFISPSGNSIGTYNRQLEEIGYTFVNATLTNDKQGFYFQLEIS